MKTIHTLVLSAVLLGAALPACAKPDAAATAENTDGIEELMKLLPDAGKPKLWIGDKAPKLQLSEFVKGEPVDGFTEGHVYVVEFWATWCGPCVASMPHLTETQKRLDKKATVISVNIWDREYDRRTKKFTESAEDHSERIGEFIKKKGKTIGYRVAIEQGKKMADSWMKPAGQNGIPAAFIVDQHGRIAWIGHPMGFDEPIDKIIAGEYDIEAAGEAAMRGQIGEAAFGAFMEGIHSDDDAEIARAEQIVRVMTRIASDDDPMAAMALNAFAWTIVDDAEQIGHRDYKLALKAATKACELTGWKDPMILDTYAMAAFKNGKTQIAIRKQKKAIKLLETAGEAPAEMVEELKAHLELFEEGG